MKKNGRKAALVIDGGPVSFAEIIAVAKDGLAVAISRSRAFQKRMAATEQALMTSLKKGVPVYGVNTGYGKSCGNRIDLAAAMKNGPIYLKFHWMRDRRAHRHRRNARRNADAHSVPGARLLRRCRWGFWSRWPPF